LPLSEQLTNPKDTSDKETFQPTTMPNRYKSLHIFLILSWLVGSSHSFVLNGRARGNARNRQLFLVEDDQETLFFGSSELDGVTTTTTEDASLLQSLKYRQEALKHGIGKRYVTRTQKGFLNVHYEPSDPYNTSNIVNQLEEGQIVRSTGPPRGAWVPHDAGGWSIAKFGGFTWLEPIEE
jgi:hypothetical protein